MISLMTLVEQYVQANRDMVQCSAMVREYSSISKKHPQIGATLKFLAKRTRQEAKLRRAVLLRILKYEPVPGLEIALDKEVSDE